MTDEYCGSDGGQGLVEYGDLIRNWEYPYNYSTTALQPCVSLTVSEHSDSGGKCLINCMIDINKLQLAVGDYITMWGVTGASTYNGYHLITDINPHYIKLNLTYDGDADLSNGYFKKRYLSS